MDVGHRKEYLKKFMHPFDYQKVFTLKEAFEAVSKSEGAAVFMAGGTDVLVRIKKGGLRPLRVIDMKGIPVMDGFSISENRFTIGALTRIRTLETSPEVMQNLPLLVQAAGKLGSVQVRNKATLGGNLCNAAPSAETAPALLALDACAEIYGREGRRMGDLRNFFTGPGSTILKDGEILTSLEIPLNGHTRQGALYFKLANRKAMDIAFVGVAVLLELDKQDRISKARIALGAVAPTPIRAQSAESVLEGRVLDDETLLKSSSVSNGHCTFRLQLSSSCFKSMEAEARGGFVNPGTMKVILHKKVGRNERPLTKCDEVRRLPGAVTHDRRPAPCGGPVA